MLVLARARARQPSSASGSSSSSGGAAWEGRGKVPRLRQEEEEAVHVVAILRSFSWPPPRALHTAAHCKGAKAGQGGWVVSQQSTV